MEKSERSIQLTVSELTQKLNLHAEEEEKWRRTLKERDSAIYDLELEVTLGGYPLSINC